MGNELVRYVAGTCEVKLSPEIIRKYLVCGQGNVTDQEVTMFLQLCSFQKLNPFLREVYLVKYGEYPATFITGKETFMKRANRCKAYKGHKVGISEDGKVAWAEVCKDGFEFPIRCEVDYDEYVGLKDGKPNKMWKSKPRTMLKKVALVQALREAFPEEYGGMYSQEEMSGVAPDDLPQAEVVIDGKAEVVDPERGEHGTKTAKTKSESKMPEPPEPAADKDSQFIKVQKVNKKETKSKKLQYFIVSMGDTVYSTFNKRVAEDADKIKGTETEALVLFNTVVVSGKTYYNICAGEAEEVFIVQ